MNDLGERIMRHNDSHLILVPVPEWDTEIYCKIISGEDRQNLLNLFISYEGDNQSHETEIQCAMIAACYCDEHGVRLFDDNDIDSLKRKNWRVIQRLFVICQKHNKFSATEVDDLEKNYEKMESVVSGSS